LRVLFALLVLVNGISRSADAVSVKDDAGGVVTLTAPAQRIVSLAPNVTELLFSAGAGDRIVATVEYSDYPPPARALPRVGGSAGIDFEAVVALKPDLIVGWASGNPAQTVARLRELGFPVYLVQTHRLEDVARNVERLGRLAGTEQAARAASARFVKRYHALAARYADRPPVRVFYQVLDPQLITVNGAHLISQVLRLCGGENVFAALPVLAPVVNEEAVLKADPEAIVAGGSEKEWRIWRAHWRSRTGMTAVRRGALYRIPPDLIHRDTLRVLDGAERVCWALDDARSRQPGNASPGAGESAPRAGAPAATESPSYFRPH
jgi:iron complex transport system substrate-binding protein